MERVPGIPISDRIIDQVGRFTQVATDWLTSVVKRLDETSQVVAVIVKDDQAAAIGTTAITDGDLSAGVYRLTFYLRITQPATTDSSASVTFLWQDRAISCAITSAVLNGNIVTAVASESFVLDMDKGAGLAFSTTYTSTGATPMKYKLRVVAERLS